MTTEQMNPHAQHVTVDADADSRILVIANATCPCPVLHDAIVERVEGESAQVLIVAPALNSRVSHWVSDTEGAERRARERLSEAVHGLRERGVDAHGRVGDGDPSVALDDYVHEFHPTEIVISTHPPERSHWLERKRDLVEQTRKRYDVRVDHFVTPYGLDEAEQDSARAAQSA